MIIIMKLQCTLVYCSNLPEFNFLLGELALSFAVFCQTFSKLMLMIVWFCEFESLPFNWVIEDMALNFCNHCAKIWHMEMM